MAVKLLKLSSGEEVIADVVEPMGEDKFYELKMPMRLIPIPSGDQIGIAMMDFSPCIEEKNIKLHEDHVMLCVEPMSVIKHEYCTKFGIVIAPSKIFGSTSLKLV